MTYTSKSQGSRGTKRSHGDMSVGSGRTEYERSSRAEKRRDSRKLDKAAYSYSKGSKGSKGFVKGKSDRHSHSHSSTPYKYRSQNLNNDVNMNFPVDELLKQRENEAEYIVRNDLEQNSNVPLIVRPRKRTVANVSRLAADYASAKLEEFISSSDDNRQGFGYQESFLSLIDLVIPQASDNTSKPKLVFEKESEMYPSIAALFQLIGLELAKYSKQNNKKSRSMKPNRHIQVCKRFDVNPNQMDTDRKVDMALYLSNDNDDDQQQLVDAEPDYEYIFAIVKAKLSSIESKQHEAYKQLVAYSYDIYTRQINRRFAWGFTACSSVFRACVLSNDKVYSSDGMDVSTKEGRAALVQLLADIAYCSDDQLGYDPTIYYDNNDGNNDDDCDDGSRESWKIKVFQDNKFETFRICKVMKAASSIFRRHTRCFRCCRIYSEKNSKEHDNGSDSDDGDGDGDDDKYLIVKDAWAFSDRKRDSEQGLRDEVELMRTVNKALHGKEQFKDRYPTLICGGVVQLSDEKGGYFDDSEDTALAALNNIGNAKDEAYANSYRVHKRMALKPIGQHISTVKFVDELIVVAADVMKVYMEIRNGCNILHRDISDNNVLVYRDIKGQVHGVLIDFD
ncbi:hypothetical protein LPJ64_006380, partial [Coemansia asiatica]